ncbi:MAG: SIS domain-containing protein [Candidatus Spyradocola sp.]
MNDILNRFCADNPALAPLRPDVVSAYELLRDTFASGGKLLICGNGGSAADAEHITGELMKGFLKKRPLTAEDRALFADTPDIPEGFADRLQGALPALALNTHSALLSAYANDVDASMVYAQQVWALGQGGDTLLALSTSGNSRNVVNAVHAARAKGLHTLAITGSADSALSRLCERTLRMPATETYCIQEYTLPTYHALCALLEAAFFAE